MCRDKASNQSWVFVASKYRWTWLVPFYSWACPDLKLFFLSFFFFWHCNVFIKYFANVQGPKHSFYLVCLWWATSFVKHLVIFWWTDNIFVSQKQNHYWVGRERAHPHMGILQKAPFICLQSVTGKNCVGGRTKSLGSGRLEEACEGPEPGLLLWAWHGRLCGQGRCIREARATHGKRGIGSTRNVHAEVPCE